MPMKVRATRLRTFEVSRPLSDVNLYGCGEGGSVSCTLSSPAASLVSCLPLSPGPCLKSRVSCLLLLSLVSCPLSRVSCLVCLVSCLSCLSCVLFVSCLVFVSSNPVSFLSIVSCLLSPITCLLSLVSSLLCPLSCLSLVFLSLVFLSLVSCLLSSCLLSFFGSCLFVF